MYAAVVEAERALRDKPSDDPAIELLQRCTRFAAAVGEFSVGTLDHEVLVQGEKKAFKNFHCDILATVPQFIPFEKSSKEGAKQDYKETSWLTDDIELVDGSEVDAKVVRLRLDLDDTRAEIQKCVLQRLYLARRI